MSPAALIPTASVAVAPGTSIVVKTPRLNRKPWAPLALVKKPTMSPAALIPKASVAVAPGTSIAVKVNADARSEDAVMMSATALSTSAT